MNAEKQTPKSIIKSLVHHLIPTKELCPQTIDEVVQLPSFYEKIQQFEHKLQTPFAELSFDFQNALIERRLEQLINIMFLNCKWKERFAQFGIEKAPTNFQEWQNLPISDKNTMAKLFMNDRLGMIVPLSYGGFEIVASGGTSSGQPVETVYSLQELWDTYKIAGEFMGKYILPPYLTGNAPKWMITTLADYQMWSSGTMVGGVLQNIPNINYIGAGPVSKEVYEHMMSFEGPKAIMGISQGIALLSDLGKDLSDKAKESFKLALFGSGLIPSRKQQELKALYPNLSIMSYFAATQAETIGLQQTPDSFLVTIPGLHLVEVVDENGQWVKEGEEGELVVTRLHANEAPIIRFKLGDRVIRRPNTVSKTLKTQQFEFVGRSGDFIHICDTQYSAPLLFKFICKELLENTDINIEQEAHEVQLVNYRKEKKLYLIVAVDNPTQLNEKLKAKDEDIDKFFCNALVKSLSVYNKSEANSHAITKTGYCFHVEFVDRYSTKIFRTSVGKTPLVRDIF